MLNRTIAGSRLEPIHLVSGKGTTLRDLAGLAQRYSRKPLLPVYKDANPGQIGHFVGDPTRAARLLDWTSHIDLETGFSQLVSSYSIT